jgi:hypothetical protein
MPYAHNPYIELVGETLFVSVMLLIAFTLAGAWRQPWLPRWSSQVAASCWRRCCRPCWCS